MITLTAGEAKVQIVPQMGAGLAGLWAHNLPVLRPWSGRETDGPFALACNLLVPFSNRISGGFSFDGQHHAMTPNLSGEPYPIHGDGFRRAWALRDCSPTHADLVLQDGAIGPFLYTAQVHYSLTADSLETRLSVTNEGSSRLPFGLGLHPWFPRDAATRLRFAANGHWPETPDHLPATLEAVPAVQGGPGHDPAPLPDGWINMGFSGWDGCAQISQGPMAASVSLTTSGLGTALLYSPSARADFFCFEPISHPVDAHNLPGQPGLQVLAPGADLNVSMTLTWGPYLTPPQDAKE
jgi:aldose 1-epimerase